LRCGGWYKFTDVSEVRTASIIRAIARMKEVLTEVLLEVLTVAIISAIALMMEALQTSEMLTNLHKSTRRYNPQDSHLCLASCIVV
jgi:hypothetical protein